MLLPLIGLYQQYFAQAMQALAESTFLEESPGQPHVLELSFLLFKTIAKLIIYGWGGPSALTQEERKTNEQLEQQQRTFCKDVLHHFQQIQASRRDKALAGQLAAAPYCERLNKHVIAYFKFYEHLLKNNHLNFHSLGITHDLCAVFWRNVAEGAADLPRLVSNEDHAALFPEKFFVNQLLFLKSCFTQYPTKLNDWQDAAYAQELVDLIVFKLLPLRAVDLERWQDEPEEWFKDEEEERWRFDLRVCYNCHGLGSMSSLTRPPLHSRLHRHSWRTLSRPTRMR